MPKSSTTVIPSAEKEYRRYIESGSWQCLKGGAHRWVEVVKGTGVYKCGKCNQAREFKTPEMAFNDGYGGGLMFGVRGAFDALQRGLV
jgi:hypothetical protein